MTDAMGVSSGRLRMPRDRSGMTCKVEIQSPTGSHIEGYITANVGEDGRVGEIFLTGWGKEGSTMDGWVQLAAMLFSVSLQYGTDFEVLVRKLATTKFEPYGRTNHPAIPWCNSVPDFIVRWLAVNYGSDELIEQLTNGDWSHEAIAETSII